MIAKMEEVFMCKSIIWGYVKKYVANNGYYRNKLCFTILIDLSKKRQIYYEEKSNVGFWHKTRSN